MRIPTAAQKNEPSLPVAATLCSWTRHFTHDCPSPIRSAKRGEYGTPPGRQSYPGRGSSIKERSINTTLRIRIIIIIDLYGEAETSKQSILPC